MLKIIILCTGLLSAASFYIRLNFWPLHQSIGLYQGDLWYFHSHYGYQILNNFFYPIEYPVGYVIIQKITAFLSTVFNPSFTYESFILANAILMIPLIIGTVILVDKLAILLGVNRKLTLLYLILSPTFFIASTTNYDIYPVFLVLFSVLLLLKNHTRSAFIFLGLGTVIKLYPAFLIPLFILYCLHKKISYSKVVQSVILFSLVVAFINLPFILYNFSYWIFPFAWQTQNPQMYDPNTISYYLPINSTAFLLVLLGIAYLISFTFYLKKKLSDQNFIYLTYLILFTAVFGNHVNTPQYLLWFLPFVSLTQLPMLILWWPFDLINSSILFSYFRLTSEWRIVQYYIFSTSVIYFTALYFYLLIKLRSLYAKD